jgi:hypothetical protein
MPVPPGSVQSRKRGRRDVDDEILLGSREEWVGVQGKTKRRSTRSAEQEVYDALLSILV